jgi:hypothetical protein
MNRQKEVKIRKKPNQESKKTPALLSFPVLGTIRIILKYNGNKFNSITFHAINIYRRIYFQLTALV